MNLNHLSRLERNWLDAVVTEPYRYPLNPQAREAVGRMVALGLLEARRYGRALPPSTLDYLAILHPTPLGVLISKAGACSA